MTTANLMIRRKGADLQVGDTFDLIGGNDTIVSFSPYVGPLDCGSEGARIAAFARGRQMTIEGGQTFDVVAR